MPKKRLRIIAGPNGSGKTDIIKPALETRSVSLGYYVNADDIEAEFKNSGAYSFAEFPITCTAAEFIPFAEAHGLTKKYRDIVKNAPVNEPLPSIDFKTIKWEKDKMVLPVDFPLAYFAAMVADYIRIKLLATGENFTFETVMSDPGKIVFLKSAKEAGYSVYLYYATTASADINVGRVRARAEQGKHNVDEKLIRSRYEKSMGLLLDAVRTADKTYLWDNSYEKGKHLFVGSFIDGEFTPANLNKIPMWFKKYIDDKLQNK